MSPVAPVSRAAVVLACLSLLGALLLAAAATLAAELSWLVAPFAGLGAVLVVAALLAGWPGALGLGVGLLAVAWTLTFVVRPTGPSAELDPAVVLAAPGLLLTAELGCWSLEHAVRRPGACLDGAVTARRVGELAAVALAAALGAAAVLAVAAGVSGRGLGLEALGVTGVLVLLCALVAAAGRQRAAPR